MLNRTLRSRIGDLKAHYEEFGWVSIKDVLEEQFAQREYQKYCQEQDWEIVTIYQGRPFMVSIHELRAQAPEFRNQFIHDAVNYAAQSPFQYFYENVRLQGPGAVARARYSDILDTFNSQEFLEIMGEITEPDADRVIETQMTKYSAGYFLKQHDDGEPGDSNQRLCAFVLNMTKNWRPDWGGSLHIQNDDGSNAAAVAPGFNQLNLFKVPRKHFVSQVANYCPESRLAMSGWLAK